MDKIRMLVLAPFTRNLDGQIVVGEPEHPDENARFVRVSPAAAKALEDEELAEPYSEEDEIRDRIKAEDDEKAEEERQQRIEQGNPDGGRNVGGASTDGIPPNKSSQAVRNERTNTARRKAQPREKGAAPRPGRRGGAPAGGNDTNASTNHPDKTTEGEEVPNAGSAGTAPDPDAPPA